jgi:hypothetical protein
MSRRAHCAKCDEDFTVETTRGRLPRLCTSCGPEAAAREAARRARRVGTLQELADLRAKVLELERQLAAGRPPRATVERPSRELVGRAVRKVAAAEGTAETVTRLRELASEALAWADNLDDSVRVDHPHAFDA